MELIALCYRAASLKLSEVSSHTGQNGLHLKKNLQIINAGEDVEKRELSCSVDENVTDTVTMETSMQVP